MPQKPSRKKPVNMYKNLFKGVGEATLYPEKLVEGDHYLRVDAVSIDSSRNNEMYTRVNFTVVDSSGNQKAGQEVADVPAFQGDYFAREMKKLCKVLLNLDEDQIDDESAMSICGLDEDGEFVDGDDGNPCKDMLVYVRSVAKPKKKSKDPENPDLYIDSTYIKTLTHEEALETVGEDLVKEYFPEGVNYFDPYAEEEE